MVHALLVCDGLMPYPPWFGFTSHGWCFEAWYAPPFSPSTLCSALRLLPTLSSLRSARFSALLPRSCPLFAPFAPLFPPFCSSLFKPMRFDCTLPRVLHRGCIEEGLFGRLGASAVDLSEAPPLSTPSRPQVALAPRYADPVPVHTPVAFGFRTRVLCIF